MNKEIAFWGSEPPPIGGMTVHIKRLSEHLFKQGWNVTQYNFTGVKRDDSYSIYVKNVWLWYLKLWLFPSPRIHYVITTTSYVRFLASLLTLRGKKVVIRVGGRSLERGLSANNIRKVLNIVSLKLCTVFIGVNEAICAMASNHTTSNKIHCIPGFIPPSVQKDPPDEIVRFFKSSPLKIVITGQVVDESEEDIYGLYHSLESLKLLKEKGVDFKCCIVCYIIKTNNNGSEIQYFRDRVEEMGLDRNVMVYYSKGELWPILKECDLFLRTSITDGDANSIREALYFNKDVIASDAVVRPDGCVLYKTLDDRDLANIIESLRYNKPQREINKVDNLKVLIDVIDGLR